MRTGAKADRGGPCRASGWRFVECCFALYGWDNSSAKYRTQILNHRRQNGMRSSLSCRSQRLFLQSSFSLLRDLTGAVSGSPSEALAATGVFFFSSKLPVQNGWTLEDFMF